MHEATLDITAQDTDYRQQYVQIGKRLREARITQGLSLQDLHERTWVSAVLIRILEAGDVTRFPEEVYLRRLVERLGSALGWDNINQELPQVAIANVLPSWYNPELSASLNFSIVTETPVQAYLGYILMITGLLGSVGWVVSNQWQVEAASGEPTFSTIRQQCQPECTPQVSIADPLVEQSIEWSLPLP